MPLKNGYYLTSWIKPRTDLELQTVANFFESSFQDLPLQLMCLILV